MIFSNPDWNNMSKAVLEDLIARLKAEAAAHAGPLDHSGATDAPAAWSMVKSSSSDSALATAELADNGALERIFTVDDGEFVDAAYRLLLHREPDPSGRAHYEQQLALGASRLGLATKLRLSKEGRRINAQLPGTRVGLLLSALLSVLRRIGLNALASRLARYVDRRYVHRYLGRTLIAWRERFERTVGAVLRHERRLYEISHVLLADQHGQKSKLAVPQETLDAYYVAFEEANRGTREAISAKLAVYENWLTTVPANAGETYQIVDLGCGRGEWMEYVTQRGLRAIGIDANRQMVDACLERGFDARCVDALTFLRSLPTGSVAAVTGFHIIEHLPFDYLFALVQESYRVVVEGGSVLVETPNPENVLVGSHTFYHDFTHRNPVTPSAISFLLKYHGFDAIDIIRSSPYPEEAKVPGDDPLTARVNGHLCGPQDFAAVGRKPKAAGTQS
jgi:SAM-dependent methyltransferase